jgi:hypothetical protein
MINIKDLTVKNFMSVGNVSQAVDFKHENLTLILGENLDQGGDTGGHRNGTGKCVCKDTTIKVRNTQTGQIYHLTIKELYELATQQVNVN